MKPLSSILIFTLLLGQTKSSTAQLWTYLNYDPKVEKAFEKTLDKEACSVTTRTEIVHGEKSNYNVRTYCIESFDGNRTTIDVSERLHGHNLSIREPGDSINIKDISGLVKVHFLRPELLEIVYSPRGGSDQGFDYVMILGIEKGRFHIVTEFLTINEYAIPDEYHLYEVRLKLKGQTLHDCKLIANVRYLRKSDTGRFQNDERKSIHTLKFDEDRKIFYNRIESLNAIFQGNTAAAKDRPIKGDYPMVDLGSDEKYYYIDDTWYALAKDDATQKNILSPVH